MKLGTSISEVHRFETICCKRKYHPLQRDPSIFLKRAHQQLTMGDRFSRVESEEALLNFWDFSALPSPLSISSLASTRLLTVHWLTCPDTPVPQGLHRQINTIPLSHPTPTFQVPQHPNSDPFWPKFRVIHFSWELKPAALRKEPAQHNTTTCTYFRFSLFIFLNSRITH